jgi:hypothetical protein
MVTVQDLLAKTIGTPWRAELRVRPLASTGRGIPVTSVYWERRDDGDDILVLGCDTKSLAVVSTVADVS